MNKNKSQSGSKKLVIIIIAAAVILLGVLGFVLWQNFMQPKADESVKANTNKTLTISEWKVSGAYSVDTELSYEVKSNSLLLKSKDTEFFDTVGAVCNNGIGAVYREMGSLEVVTPGGETTTIAANFKKVDIPSDNLWNVGEYYYTYVAPQSYCKGSDDKVLPNIEKVLSAMKEFFVSAKEI